MAKGSGHMRYVGGWRKIWKDKGIGEGISTVHGKKKSEH